MFALEQNSIPKMFSEITKEHELSQLYYNIYRRSEQFLNSYPILNCDGREHVSMMTESKKTLLKSFHTQMS